jgi:hypothetical protein
MIFAGIASAPNETASLSTAAIPFAAWHGVPVKASCSILQISLQNFLGVTGQKSMNLNA